MLLTKVMMFLSVAADEIYLKRSFIFKENESLSFHNIIQIHSIWWIIARAGFDGKVNAIFACLPYKKDPFQALIVQVLHPWDNFVNMIVCEPV